MTEPDKKPAWTLAAAGAVVAAAAIAGLVFSMKPKPRGPLDESYTLVRDVPPPAECAAQSEPEINALLAGHRLLASGRLGGGAPGAQEAVKRIETIPKGAEQRYLLGKALLYALVEEREPALETLKEAAALCPSWAAPVNLIGAWYLIAGDLAPAKKHHEKARALDPNFLEPELNLARGLLSSGDVSASVKGFTDILKRDDGYAPAYFHRGLAHIRSDAREDALRDLEKATRLNDKNAAAWLLLGQMYVKFERTPEAQDAFCRAKALGDLRAKMFCP